MRAAEATSSIQYDAAVIRTKAALDIMLCESEKKGITIRQRLNCLPVLKEKKCASIDVIVEQRLGTKVVLLKLFFSAPKDEPMDKQTKDMVLKQILAVDRQSHSCNSILGDDLGKAQSNAVRTHLLPVGLSII